MKVWNKIKYPLLLALITVLMTFIRFVTMAVPSWIHPVLASPWIVIRFIIDDLWTDILLFLVSIGAILLIPCKEKWGKLRRFLLRPIADSFLPSPKFSPDRPG